MKRFVDFHKSDEINKIFKNQYSEEIINEIKKFYFEGINMECEITRLENICHVSTYIFYLFHCKTSFKFSDNYCCLLIESLYPIDKFSVVACRYTIHTCMNCIFCLFLITIITINYIFIISLITRMFSIYKSLKCLVNRNKTKQVSKLI